jgi:hypothetical protein
MVSKLILMLVFCVIALSRANYNVEAISCAADSMRILVNQRDRLGVATAVRPPIYTKARESEKERAHALH